MHETSDFLLYSNLFIYRVFCTVIYCRHSLYSFLLIQLYNCIIILGIKILYVPIVWVIVRQRGYSNNIYIVSVHQHQKNIMVRTEELVSIANSNYNGLVLSKIICPFYYHQHIGNNSSRYMPDTLAYKCPQLSLVNTTPCVASVLIPSASWACNISVQTQRLQLCC